MTTNPNRKIRLCVGVLSFNGEKDLPKAVDSLAGQEVGEVLEFDIFILDNGSKDNSWEVLQGLKSKYPHINITLQKSESNTGFAGGHNIIIAQNLEKYDYFLPFNQDAVLRDRDVLKKLIGHARSLNNNCILQTVIRDYEGNNSAAGIRFTYVATASPTVEYLNQSPVKDYPNLVEVDIAQGAVFLIPREIVCKIGLLEEIYFAYHEDCEYSLRARLYGIKIYCATDVFVYHDQKAGRFATKKFGQYLLERNRYYYLFTHFSWALLVLLLPVLLMQELAMTYFMVSNHNWQGKKNGWKDIFTNWSGLMTCRIATRRKIAASLWKKEYYLTHKVNIDATKIYTDPKISSAAKAGMRLLEVVNLVWYGLYRLYIILFV